MRLANHNKPPKPPNRPNQTRSLIVGAGIIASLIGFVGIWLTISGIIEPGQPPPVVQDNTKPEAHPLPVDLQPQKEPLPPPEEQAIDNTTQPITPTEDTTAVSEQVKPLTPSPVAPMKKEAVVKPATPQAPPEVQNLLKQWAETKAKVYPNLKKFQYQDAISLCSDFYSKRVIPLEFTAVGVDAGLAKLKKEVNAYLDELKGARDIFLESISEASPKPNKAGEIVRKKVELDTMQIWVTRADEKGIEAEIAGVSGSRYYRQWPDMPARVMYDLLPPAPSGKAVVYKAIFCYNHNLGDEGEQILISYYQRNPNEKKWIDEVLARYNPDFSGQIPQGGFVIYQRQWVTPQDKYYLEKGYIRYNNVWMPYEQMMQLKGLVKFQDRWVTAKEKDKLDAQFKALEALKTRLAPKGIIDKPGADAEPRPWATARVKETPHYRIKTNLSEDALNDVGFVMECLYFEFKKVFKLSADMPLKLDVWVFRTQQEYLANGGRPGTGGIFTGAKVSNDSSGTIMSFYQTRQLFNTTMVLLHEGTHQFIMLGTGTIPPIWVNEGLATYYESSKFEGTTLKTNLINKGRLWEIQKAIKDGNYPKMRDFINTPQASYKSLQYAQGWSLIYFFFNWRDGYYADELEKYFNYCKKAGSNLSAQQNIDAFERTFNVKIDVLEEQWKDYVQQLK